MTKRTKALHPTAKVRAAVLARDSVDDCPVCQICGTAHQLDIAHFVAKSQSGLGVEENLIVLCRVHHEQADHGYPEERKRMRRRMRERLQGYYGESWSEEMLHYRRE